MTTFQPDPNTPIYVALKAQPGVQPTSRGDDLIERSEAALRQAMSTIYQMAEQVQSTVEAIPDPRKPDQVEVTFGITLGGEANAYIAKTSGEASFTVKMTWHNEED